MVNVPYSGSSAGAAWKKLWLGAALMAALAVGNPANAQNSNTDTSEKSYELFPVEKFDPTDSVYQKFLTYEPKKEGKDSLTTVWKAGIKQNPYTFHLYRTQIDSILNNLEPSLYISDTMTQKEIEYIKESRELVIVFLLDEDVTTPTTKFLMDECRERELYPIIADLRHKLYAIMQRQILFLKGQKTSK